MNKFRITILSIALISIILGLIIGKSTNFFEVSGFEKALEGFLLFSSITLGFFGTCVSILATLMGTKTVKDVLGVQHYRMDFAFIAISTLASGFIGIVVNVFFQIHLSNVTITEESQKILTGMWGGAVIAYLSYLGLFIMIVMYIFLEAGEDAHEDLVEEGRVTKSILNKK